MIKEPSMLYCPRSRGASVPGAFVRGRLSGHLHAFLYAYCFGLKMNACTIQPTDVALSHSCMTLWYVTSYDGKGVLQARCLDHRDVCSCVNKARAEST